MLRLVPNKVLINVNCDSDVYYGLFSSMNYEKGLRVRDRSREILLQPGGMKGEGMAFRRLHKWHLC